MSTESFPQGVVSTSASEVEHIQSMDESMNMSYLAREGSGILPTTTEIVNVESGERIQSNDDLETVSPAYGTGESIEVPANYGESIEVPANYGESIEVPANYGESIEVPANYALQSSDLERSASPADLTDVSRPDGTEGTVTEVETAGNGEPNTEGEITEDVTSGEDLTEDETEVAGVKHNETEGTDPEEIEGTDPEFTQTEGPTDADEPTDLEDPTDVDGPTDGEEVTDMEEPTDGEEVTDLEDPTDGENVRGGQKTTEDEDEDDDDEGDTGDDVTSDEDGDEDVEESTGDARHIIAKVVNITERVVNVPKEMVYDVPVGSYTVIGGGASPLHNGTTLYAVPSLVSSTNAIHYNSTKEVFPSYITSQHGPSSSISSYGSPTAAVTSYTPTSALFTNSSAVRTVSASGIVAATPSGITAATPLIAGATRSGNTPAAASGITPATPSAIATAVPSAIATAVPSGIATAVPSGIATAVPSGIATGAPSVIAAAAASGMTTVTSSGMPPSIASDLTRTNATMGPMMSVNQGDIVRIGQVRTYSNQVFNGASRNTGSLSAAIVSQSTTDSQPRTVSQNSLPITTASLGTAPTSAVMSQPGLTVTASTLGSTVSAYPSQMQISSANLSDQGKSDLSTIAYGQHTTPAAVGSRYTSIASPVASAPLTTTAMASGLLTRLSGSRQVTGESRGSGLQNLKFQSTATEVIPSSSYLPQRVVSSSGLGPVTTSANMLSSTMQTRPYVPAPVSSVAPAALVQSVIQKTSPFSSPSPIPVPTSDARSLPSLAPTGSMHGALPPVQLNVTTSAASGINQNSMQNSIPAPITVSQFAQGTSHTTPARAWENSTLTRPFGSQTTPHIQASRGISSFSKLEASVISGAIPSMVSPIGASVHAEADRLASHNPSYLSFPQQIRGTAAPSPAAPFLVNASQHPAAPFMVQQGPAMAASVGDASILGQEQQYDLSMKAASRAGSESKKCSKGKKHHSDHQREVLPCVKQTKKCLGC